MRLPRLLSAEALEQQADEALREFVKDRLAEGTSAYGQQVVTAALLSGVFKIGNLIDAQNGGVFIFWEHRIDELREFVGLTCSAGT